jgi:ligand-binding sensor domain-containing protein/signal transduction histidine kinase
LRWLSVVGAVVASLIQTPAAAIEVTSVIDDYSISGWSQRDGLPPGSIYALAKDGDGFLWVGTALGLYVFDGMGFSQWRGAGSDLVPAKRVRGLVTDFDGSIVAALGDGPMVFARFRDGRAEVSDGLPGYDRSRVIFFDRDESTLWMGTEHGLYRLEQYTWAKFQAPGFPEDAVVYDRLETRAGALLISTSLGIFQRRKGSDSFSAIETFDYPITQNWQNPPNALVEDRSGLVYVTDRTRGYRPVGGRTKQVESGHGLTFLSDHDGSIWLGTGGQGLWRLQLEPKTGFRVERLTAATGLLGNGVSAILEDADGNLWIGNTEGLNRLTPKKVEQLPLQSVVLAVATLHDTSMIVATPDHVIRFRHGPTRVEDLRATIPGASISAMCVDESDRTWVGTSRGVASMAASAREMVVIDGTQTLTNVTSMSSDGQGGVWLFDQVVGLVHWRDGILPVPLNLRGKSGQVNYLFTDRSGVLWIGRADGILTISATGLVKSYGTGEGLPAGAINGIFEDPRGAIWVAGDFGIGQLRGDRFYAIVSSDAFPIQLAAAIEAADPRSVWVGAVSGLFLIERSDLENALAQGAPPTAFRRFGRADGLAGVPGVVYPNRRVARSPDGDLWFVTGRGLAIVHPMNLPHQEAPQPVHIVAVDRNETPWDFTLTRQLPAGTTRLSIHYAAPNLTSPLRTRYRYMLEGYDKDWVNAGRDRQASYTNLPPGDYRFRVAVRSDDAAWPEMEEVWSFSIAPYFYQTRMALGVVAVAIALLVWAGWWFRVRRMRRQFLLVLQERARLSRDIHDTILQGLVGVAFQLEAICDPERQRIEIDRDVLVRLRKYLESYIRESRQAIRDLRSTKLGTRDLGSAIRDSAISIINGRPITFDFAISGEQVRLPSAVESTLIRISDEAISNAVMHSGATKLQVHVEFNKPTLTLSILDSGRGFDPGVRSSGSGAHFGLQIIRERAEEIGAQVLIESVSGKGTTVSVEMPLPA